MDVRVRLLGPVGLEVDGSPVALGSSLRLILAVLALARGRAVAGARLAELVWGEPVPDAAATTLRSHVAHLRRLVEPHRPPGHAPSVVVTEKHGYALRLPPERIDSVRFEHLLTEARDALHGGDPAAAARSAAHALRLWHAPALADLTDRPFAVAEAARLDALRAEARRLRATAELELGRPDDALPVLRELVAADPADERLRGLLVRALCDTGRRDTAAEVCADGVRLAHERGLDATALRARQTEVLRGAPPAPAGPRPFQLPPDVGEFTGRAAELAALLADPASVLAVDGRPGVGKSALAVRLAHRVAHRFPDGVLYVNLRGAQVPQLLAPAAVLGRFLGALGTPHDRVPADLDAASALYRSELAGRRVLVVLDNAADAAQVRPLLPATPGCVALVTSRRALVDLDVGSAVTLDLLSTDDAVTLLGRVAGRTRVDADPGAALAVVGYCGLLPLAVRIAGARLRARPAWPMAAFADRLADEHRRLGELAVGDLAVRSSFRLGYHALDPGDARLFRLLGLLDAADVTAPVAAAVAGLADASDAEAALERLVDAQLVEAHPAGRYRFHDLLRLYARECAVADEPPDKRDAALAAGLGWYERTARAAVWWLRPVTERPSGDGAPEWLRWADERAALAWLDAERANLVSITGQAAVLPAVAHVAWRVEDALLPYFNNRKPWPDWHAIAHAARQAAEAAGDQLALALAHRHLGIIAAQQRLLPLARDHMWRSLEIFERFGEHAETARMFGDLGVLNAQLGDHDAALDCLTRALVAARGSGKRTMEAVVLNNLGLLHCERGRYDLALGCVQRALAMEHDLNGTGESATLETLGTIHLRQGRFADAADAYRRSLAVARALGNRWSEAHALGGLGQAVAGLDGAEAARPHLVAALDIFTSMRAPEADDLRRLLEPS